MGQGGDAQRAASRFRAPPRQWEQAQAVSCLRPGRTGETHSGRPSGAEMTGGAGDLAAGADHSHPQSSSRATAKTRPFRPVRPAVSELALSRPRPDRRCPCDLAVGVRPGQGTRHWRGSAGLRGRGREEGRRAGPRSLVTPDSPTPPAPPARAGRMECGVCGARVTVRLRRVAGRRPEGT